MSLIRPNFPVEFFDQSRSRDDRIQLLRSNRKHYYIYFDAISNVPDVDIIKLLSTPMLQNHPEVVIVMHIVYSVLCGGVCDACEDRTKPQELLLCSKCKLAWYCNEACRARHAGFHSRRCCQPCGPYEPRYQTYFAVTY